jgi:hypothetical protein
MADGMALRRQRGSRIPLPRPPPKTQAEDPLGLDQRRTAAAADTGKAAIATASPPARLVSSGLVGYLKGCGGQRHLCGARWSPHARDSCRVRIAVRTPGGIAPAGVRASWGSGPLCAAPPFRQSAAVPVEPNGSAPLQVLGLACLLFHFGRDGTHRRRRVSKARQSAAGECADLCLFSDYLMYSEAWLLKMAIDPITLSR